MFDTIVTADRKKTQRINMFFWLRRFQRLCLLGLLISVVLWVLPASIKPFHIRRFLDDYKTELVEQRSEKGFGPRGIIYGHYSIQYSGGTRVALDPIRQTYKNKLLTDKTPWPDDSSRLHYDEWGPIHYTQPDGVGVLEVGSEYCLPYSVMAIGSAVVWILLQPLKKPAKPQPPSTPR